MVNIEKNPKSILIFVIDEFGRTLSKDYLRKLISELFDKALDKSNVEAVVANGPTINDCLYLADQIIEKDIAEWEIIYLHVSKYPPVLLTAEDKETLVTLLHNFSGTSAAAIYKVLTDFGAYDTLE